MPTTLMPHLDDHAFTDPDDRPEQHAPWGPESACFGCWCYSCGGRTDQPRIERENDEHAGDPSHRWCFE